jgi:hypothetical protein
MTDFVKAHHQALHDPSGNTHQDGQHEETTGIEEHENRTKSARG